MKQILKTLLVLILAALCLTSDTATSLVAQGSHRQNLSGCSSLSVSNGPMPKYWDCPKSTDVKSEPADL